MNRDNLREEEMSNTLFPGLPDYVGPQSGYYGLVHHDTLYEWSDGIDERVKYIQRYKPESEQALRLACLIYIDPAECPAVATLIAANAEYEKVVQQARAEYEKVEHEARAEYEKVERPTHVEYEKVAQAAHAEYKRVVQPAHAEYEKAVRPAHAEYKKVVQAAHAEYEKIQQQAHVEYDKAVQPARAEYEKVLHEANVVYQQVERKANAECEAYIRRHILDLPWDGHELVFTKEKR